LGLQRRKWAEFIEKQWRIPEQVIPAKPADDRNRSQSRGDQLLQQSITGWQPQPMARQVVHHKHLRRDFLWLAKVCNASL